MQEITKGAVIFRLLINTGLRFVESVFPGYSNADYAAREYINSIKEEETESDRVKYGGIKRVFEMAVH